MKYISILILSIFFIISCGDSKTFCIKPMSNSLGCAEYRTYETYGFIDKDEIKDPNIEYKLVIGTLIWSVLLSGTIVAPILILGLDMYEPLKLKDSIRIQEL